MPTLCDCIYLDSDDDNSTIVLLTTVLATRNLLTLTCTTTYQNLGEIGVTLNESNVSESDMSSTGLILIESVCELSRTRAYLIRHLWSIKLNTCKPFLVYWLYQMCIESFLASFIELGIDDSCPLCLWAVATGHVAQDSFTRR
jgi:hypothetical protein